MYRSNNICINQRIAFRKHHNSVTVSAEVSSLELLTGVHAIDGLDAIIMKYNNDVQYLYVEHIYSTHT